MERTDDSSPLTPSAVVMNLLGKVGDMANVTVVWLDKDGFTHIAYSDERFSKIIGQMEYAKWTLCNQFAEMPEEAN